LKGEKTNCLLGPGWKIGGKAEISLMTQLSFVFVHKYLKSSLQKRRYNYTHF